MRELCLEGNKLATPVLDLRTPKGHNTSTEHMMAATIQLERRV